jgi:hypothetical protein
MLSKCRKRIYAVLVIAVLTVTISCGFPTSVLAAVYICTNDSCSQWNEITQAQKEIKARTPDQLQIQTALSESKEEAVRNGSNNIGGWNTYLKSSLWHRGGDWSTTYESYDHLTAYMYKNNENRKTCHVYSLRLTLTAPSVATFCQAT